jgi:hypothetical protein
MEWLRMAKPQRRKSDQYGTAVYQHSVSVKNMAMLFSSLSEVF